MKPKPFKQLLTLKQIVAAAQREGFGVKFVMKGKPTDKEIHNLAVRLRRKFYGRPPTTPFVEAQGQVNWLNLAEWILKGMK